MPGIHAQTGLRSGFTPSGSAAPGTATTTVGGMPRLFVIDTDTASDDAVALVMALMHPDITVEAITIVAGNVPLPMAVNNALLTVERCVAAGAPRCCDVPAASKIGD